jgi:hypothetical protein
LILAWPAKLNTLFEIHTNMARLSTTSNRMEPIQTTTSQLMEGGRFLEVSGFRSTVGGAASPL